MHPAHRHAWQGPHPTGQIWLRTALLWFLSFSILGLTGCAQLPPPQPKAAGHAYWNGRLALQIEDPSAQSYSAGFELHGNPAQGELVLTSPLGNVLAHLRWAPGQAMLVSGNETQTAASLDALVVQATGTPIPITALFDWLNGVAANATGWQADMSRLEQGRLTAVRHTPEPRATLRIALDR